MKLLPTVLVLAFTGVALAKEMKPEYIKKNMIFVATECSISFINMTTGKLTVDKGELATTACLIDKPFSALCTFLDSKDKEITRKRMTNIIEGQEAIVSSDSQADTIILNLVTRKFYQAANIYSQHGAGRGQKTCAGWFVYADEVNGKKTAKYQGMLKKTDRSPASTVRVNGYMKSNGTYVAPHIRTSPDSSTYNNFNPRPANTYDYGSGTKSRSKGW